MGGMALEGTSGEGLQAWTSRLGEGWRDVVWFGFQEAPPWLLINQASRELGECSGDQIVESVQVRRSSTVFGCEEQNREMKRAQWQIRSGRIVPLCSFEVRTARCFCTEYYCQMESINQI
ncbi:hypothetical protein H0G86_000395 [Trichoderma simmonsii]|uniref:Uncharacterized protein n=1 Tax=Trichoderma simmonsii TaxID=1491479 RepID=A0A8G0L4U8_9HYPO|nr:hypothetical protein H0G86_000395 [Trichoderma simmonsii]